MKRLIIYVFCIFLVVNFLSCSNTEDEFTPLPPQPPESALEREIRSLYPENYDCIDFIEYQWAIPKVCIINAKHDTAYFQLPVLLPGYKPYAMTDSFVRCRDGQNHVTAYSRLYDPRHSILFADAVYDDKGMIVDVNSRLTRDTVFVFDNVKYFIRLDGYGKSVLIGKPKLPFHSYVSVHGDRVNFTDIYYVDER